MALIACSNCGHQVSTKAPRCPECGTPPQFRFCTRCGNPFGKREKRCPACGTSQDEASPEDNLQARSRSSGFSNLTEEEYTDEPELLRIHPSWRAYSFQLCFILLYVLFGVSVMLANFPDLSGQVFGGVCVFVAGSWAWLLCSWRKNRYWVITTSRITESRGIVARSKREIEIQDIRAVDVGFGFWARLFAVGHVIVSSAARDDSSIIIVGIRHPERVAKLIRDTRRTIRSTA